MKARWLDRDTVRAPYLMLCLSEKDYLKAARHCRLKSPPPWLDEERQMACVHTWELKGKLTCIVCLHPDAREAKDPIEVTEALVHEAVHVFQRLCDSIGEQEPSREFEAYAIERIAGQLLREYARRAGSHGRI